MVFDLGPLPISFQVYTYWDTPFLDQFLSFGKCVKKGHLPRKELPN